jgi:hypothetical protein
MKCLDKPAMILCSSDARPATNNRVRVTGDTVTHPAFSSDAECLYSVRSKSVVKRREELIKKKLDESKLKLDAKYRKIEKLQQNRNMFRVPSN